MNQVKQNIESKLSQAKYVLKVMQKYRGKVFVEGGLDSETGAYPLQVHVSSFLTHTRSVLQYAHRECKKNNKENAYESAVKDRPIIAVFRNLRNIDVHQQPIGIQTTIHLKLPIFRTEKEAIKVEKNEPEEAKIITCLTKPLVISNSLIERLHDNGQDDLADAAVAGKPLYEAIQFEGEEDLFELCELYIKALNEFVLDLLEEDFI